MPSSSSWSSSSCRTCAPRSFPCWPSRSPSSARSPSSRFTGGSINTLSLFGLILAIGIVVDDAIVVVENVERNIERGLSPTEAARVSMTEVGGALIAISLVLTAVFVPVALIGGMAGAVLPAVRDHDRLRDAHLLLRLADAVACAVRGDAEAAPRDARARGMRNPL